MIKMNPVIDERIKPLVDAMNATGLIRTIASCQGHAGLRRPPYVYFAAPVAVAASLEKALREGIVLEGWKLNYFWSIEGRFDGEYRLRFALYSPRLDKHARSVANSLMHFFVRSKLDSDLKELCVIVQDAVLNLPPLD